MGSFRALRTTARQLCLVLACTTLAAPSLAQDLPTAADAQAPAHVSFVDGVAILERDGEMDDSPANMPLLAGDRLRTRAGRVEILFADGSTLHLDHNSAIDLQSDDLLRLVEGRIRLSIPGPSREVAYRIDGPQGWARITEPGDYRLALLNGPRGSELELAVLRGHAELVNEAGQTGLRAGERAFARVGAAPSYAYVFNSAAWDAFDTWSERLRDERRGAAAEYLPEDVRPYAASLERYGYWRDEPTYGRVWYPRVAGDWRPYYRGRWVRLRPYGWTWVAHDPWGWPTHHYGRWGYSTTGWFWIPGRTWGAAWVSWAYAPGYVSWCPLGWNNRPVFAININIGRSHDPWRYWTAIPQRHFGYGYVHRNVVHVDRLDPRSRPSFTLRDRAPEPGGRAIPRGSATPIRVAGTRDQRRGETPLYTNVPADRARVRTDGPRVSLPDSRTPRAVPRDRTVPQGPAVRSERLPRADTRRQPAPGAGEPRREQPRSIEPRMDPRRVDPRGIEPPRVEPRSAQPRATEPRGANRPQWGAPSGARPQPRMAEPRATQPRRSQPSAPPPAASRPSGGIRAVPRAGTPAPDRPASGSNDRKPSPGARPRPGGGK